MRNAFNLIFNISIVLLIMLVVNSIFLFLHSSKYHSQVRICCCNLRHAIPKWESVAATCGTPFPSGNLLLQPAARHSQVRICCCNLRHVIPKWESVAATCGTPFPSGNLLLQPAAGKNQFDNGNFGSATAYLAANISVAATVLVGVWMDGWGFWFWVWDVMLSVIKNAIKITQVETRAYFVKEVDTISRR